MRGVARTVRDSAGGPIIGGGNTRVFVEGTPAAVVGDAVASHGSDAHASKKEDTHASSQWIVDRIKLLCGVFSVDLCAYAIMNNHYHIVVRIDVEQVQDWSDEEIARRWLSIFSGPLLMHQYLL